jgi:hypothetical protein
MTTRTRRLQPVESTVSGKGVVDEGAERYIWVFPEGEQLVLAIPGLRGLKFSVDEARAVGEMLTQAADEITKHQINSEGKGGDHGGSEESPVEG